MNNGVAVNPLRAGNGIKPFLVLIAAVRSSLRGVRRNLFFSSSASKKPMGKKEDKKLKVSSDFL